MYRPKNWDATTIAKPIKEGEPSGRWVSVLDVELVEAGANTMLGALKEKGIFTYGCHTPDIALEDAPDESGYWVFIPDKQVKKDE